jgi:hypothetical protein
MPWMAAGALGALGYLALATRLGVVPADVWGWARGTAAREAPGWVE